MARREQWTPAESQEWHARQPWFFGCNFIPSTAINQLEMWQAGTFDLDSCDRELGWAAGLGMNAARVFLHDLPFRTDEPAFVDRIDRFLGVAAGHGIAVMFVLFDGVWDPHPAPGPQRAPKPRVHNSGWVQSPGAEILGDPARHHEMAGYVRGVVGHFRDDPRVLAWDLFNEPENPNVAAYPQSELKDKALVAEKLLARAFGWAREAGPTQPLTAGPWLGRVAGEGVSSINRLMISESDVISFHSYLDPGRVANRIDELSEYGRPLFLTEFMARGGGSTLEAVLPLAKERGVGAFCWGLVSGRTQTIYPWDSWQRTYDGEPDPWFHDLLHSDGTPYRTEEAQLMRDLAPG